MQDRMSNSFAAAQLCRKARKNGSGRVLVPSEGSGHIRYNIISSYLIYIWRNYTIVIFISIPLIILF